MAKFQCRQTEKCTRCGRCCHIRQTLQIDEKEELEIKKKVYSQSCVVYLYSFSKYTISITNEEKERLLRLAKKKKIELKILPKKIIFDNKNAEVYDWFIDKNICPFLEGKNHCTIYNDKPEICKMFPKIENKQITDIKKIINSRKIKPINLEYEKIVELAKKALTKKGILI